MPRNVRTARGELVDFDAIIIKQQIAEAQPPTVEVQRRKDFIDSKEGKARGQRKPLPEGTIDANRFVTGAEVRQVVVNDAISTKKGVPAKAADFEPEDSGPISKGPIIEAVPVIPERK